MEKLMYPYEYRVHDKVTAWQLKERAERFTRCETVDDLANFFNMSALQLERIAQNARYDQFYRPKPRGGKRLVETPIKMLKSFQQRLHKYFQATYHTVKPACSYGCISSTADEEMPKNIYTNALQHVNNKYLLVIDLKDFYHTITTERVSAIFQFPPFKFNQTAASLLSKLTTTENRLPIGGSTSPVIANLSCLELDYYLTELADKQNWVYTRYIDDMSFSSKKQIRKKHRKAIRDIIENQGFVINEDKVTYDLIKDEPTVTGLILKPNKPDVSKDYIQYLEEDIKVYHILTSERLQIISLFSAQTLKKFRDSLFGRLNFIGFVRGRGHRSFLRLKKLLDPVKYVNEV